MSILVVGWRDAPHLARCLASLAALESDVPFEVVVALNEPTEATEAQVRSALPPDAVLEFRANLGFAGAVNQAATRARGRFVLLLNDDALVEPGWLDPLMETMRERPECGLVSSTFLDTEGAVQEAGWVVWSDATTSSVPSKLSASSMQFERLVDYGSGASLLVRREVWEQLGGLDESYYPAYYEDLDLSIRARTKGWSTWYQPKSRLRHIRSASTSSLFKDFLNHRSRSTFIDRWSDVIRSCAEPGELEDAIWRGMGCPARVLAVSGRSTTRFEDAVAQLAGSQHVHVAVACQLPAVVRERISPSIRLVDDLDDHLASDGIHYDFAMIDDEPRAAPASLRGIPRVSTEAVLGGDDSIWADRLQVERG